MTDSECYLKRINPGNVLFLSFFKYEQVYHVVYCKTKNVARFMLLLVVLGSDNLFEDFFVWNGMFNRFHVRMVHRYFISFRCEQEGVRQMVLLQLRSDYL
jgi:hypothetical protein